MVGRTYTLTLKDLLIELSNTFVEVSQTKDGKQVAMLGYTFAIIEELAKEKGDLMVYRLAMDLHDATVDFGHRAEWKSSIPSVEDIERIFEQ